MKKTTAAIESITKEIQDTKKRIEKLERKQKGGSTFSFVDLESLKDEEKAKLSGLLKMLEAFEELKNSFKNLKRKRARELQKIVNDNMEHADDLPDVLPEYIKTRDDVYKVITGGLPIPIGEPLEIEDNRRVRRYKKMLKETGNDFVTDRETGEAFTVIEEPAGIVFRFFEAHM